MQFPSQATALCCLFNLALSLCFTLGRFLASLFRLHLFIKLIIGLGGSLQSLAVRPRRIAGSYASSYVRKLRSNRLELEKSITQSSFSLRLLLFTHTLLLSLGMPYLQNTHPLTPPTCSSHILVFSSLRLQSFAN